MRNIRKYPNSQSICSLFAFNFKSSSFDNRLRLLVIIKNYIDTHQQLESNNSIKPIRFNLDNIMAFDYRYIVKAGAIALLGSLLVSQARQLIQAIMDLKELKNSKVKSINDFTKEIDQQKKSRLNLLKIKPYYFQPKSKKISIHSAERYKYQPSDQKIVAQLQKELSSKYDRRRDLYHIPVTWYAQVQPSKLSNGNPYRLIEGFGQIKGDFFDVKRHYTPETHLGYWSRFRNWIYERFYKSSSLIQESRQSLFFVGPVVGILQYEINLMKNTSIIAVCNFQDGKIIPTVTATSKSEILSYYQNFIREKYIFAGLLIIGTILIGRLIWSDIRRQLNAMKVRRNKANFKYYEAEDIPDDKLCIICYNHVRNMIFFDCRHMVLCQECSETYDSDVCPYCKMDIDDIKPVIGIP